MSIRVSFSALECFEQCSEKYRLRYIEKLSTENIPSPLFFGTAIDNAVEILLLSKKKNLSEQEQTLIKQETAQSVFHKYMILQNGVYLENSLLCEYFLSDYDESVFSEDDYKKLTDRYKIEDWDKFYISCKKCIKNKEPLSKNNKKAFNNLCWVSLYNKGLLLIEAYERDILPEIDEVFEIQKNIELVNQSGDRLVGKIDFIATLKGSNFKTIIDNKTSSKAYKEDSVKTSTQLAIYCESEGCSDAAYAVMEKKLRVREPRARTQLIVDKISDEHFNIVFDKIEKQLDNIAKKSFSKKDNPKECFAFGKKCEFFDLCWSNNSKGLKRHKRDVL